MEPRGKVALAVLATLALVSSAYAQTTYTWTGAGSDNNWFTNSDTFASDNFSSTPLVSSLTDTDLLFTGSTRPSSVLNLTGAATKFDARSVTFNTDVDFTITRTGGGTRALYIGLGGIDNQVARKQTITSSVQLSNIGTTPINVASGGEIVFNGGSFRAAAAGAAVLEKTGTGTLTLDTSVNLVDHFIISSGTVNDNVMSQVSWDLRDGVYNQGVNGGNVFIAPQVSQTSYFRQSGGISNFSGIGTDVFATEITSGTVNFNVDGTGFFSKTTISGGTIAYNGPVGGGAYFDSSSWGDPSPNGTTTPIVTISGGAHNFGAGFFGNSGGITGDSVLVTGGTATGFYHTEGLTNDGGSITFTAKASNDPAVNIEGSVPGGEGLTFTSGTVSIGTVAGGGTAIGSLVNGTTVEPLNTILGSANTLKLDLNEDLTRDVFVTAGTMIWGGTLDFNLTNTGALVSGTSWDFFNDVTLGSTGAFSGDLGGISLDASSIYGGLSFSRSGDLWTSTEVNGQNFLFDQQTGILSLESFAPSAVPEPASTFTLLALFSSGVLQRRKRVVTR